MTRDALDEAVYEARQRLRRVGERTRSMGPSVVAAAARALVERRAPRGWSRVAIVKSIALEAAQAAASAFDEELRSSRAAVAALAGGAAGGSSTLAPTFELPAELDELVVEIPPLGFAPLVGVAMTRFALRAQLGRLIEHAFTQLGYRLEAWSRAELSALADASGARSASHGD